MSVGIHFEHIVKKYGENVIIPDLNLDVREGAFFTLLGPSGCGKTTLLRMVAGFNSIEGGTIAFNGRVINDIAPNKRNIGMVFQNYAVFPHMTVRENVAFGLETAICRKNEIKRRVDEILETVKDHPVCRPSAGAPFRRPAAARRARPRHRHQAGRAADG